MAERLRRIKEDPNVLDHIDAIPFVDTPLHTAASAGQIDFAIEILRLKPSFGRKLNPDGLSSLHLAVLNDKFDTVKRLIKLDKEFIRVKGKQGNTPLHFHCQQRNLCQSRTKSTGWSRLTRKECWPASKDDKGNTALHIAVFNSQLQMVKLLVKESFVDINANNSETQIALDIALLLDQSDEARSIVNTLRYAGALESSSSANNDYSLAKFFNSPEQPLEVLYKYKSVIGRHVSMELRNHVNATVLSTNNLLAANTLSIPPTDDHVKRFPFDVPDAKHLILNYGAAFLTFYRFNTGAIVLSMASIMFAFPVHASLGLLIGALFIMMLAYGVSLYLIHITISFGYSETFFTASCWQNEGAAAETGDINGLYGSIKEAPDVLDRIDAIPFVDTPLQTAASAGRTDFAVEILRLKPSFGRKLNPDGLSSLHLALINHKKDDINADQQQRVLDDHRVNADQEQKVLDQQQRELDDHRVNTLADFLFACPNSIEDLTNQDETALHIAVRTKNKSAVEIMVKLLVKEPFANINAKNSDKQTALDHIALQHLAYVVRSAKALENSSCDENDYALAKFLNSPERCLEVLYKLQFFMGRSATMELRNIGLVVAVLIATATLTSVLSPPGGVRGGDFNLFTDGGNFNATVTSINNLFAANTSFFNATLSIPTDNPVKRLLFDAKDLEYGKAFGLFYGLNTVASVLSAAMIMFVLPGKPIY
ncbi:hypothetical protein RHSIM_Rhsim08G0165400 [Rhododendron simsii]|uniref:PGG domain-containing protein n=1 Tax=Rhododendron simsii TaxID=118357 RepID=A0A834GK64_RHOSS|nr:hypothetical protein RHSIM_Rhsim08G0165400 [Rhododendron simsii]